MSFRIIGKFGFLVAIIGFFMPMACDMNGFQLANEFGGMEAVLLYGLFVAALFGLIIGVLLLIKKNMPIITDWIAIIGCFGTGIALLIMNELELQYGAYVLGVGCIIALALQIVSVIKKEK